MIQRQVQPDIGQGLSNPGPDLGPGDSKVLQPEGDFVTDSAQHHLGVRILLEQADSSALLHRGEPIDQQLSALFTFLGSAEHPGQRVDQGRLPSPGRAQQ